MEFRAILKRRKSVRAFEQRPIPREVLERVLSSVRAAPTAGFAQGNEFLALDEPAAVSAFWAMAREQGGPTSPEHEALLAPVVVLPLAHQQAYLDRYSMPDKAESGLQQAEKWPVPYWDVDAGMASMLILLAAIEEGLGAWFFGLFFDQAQLAKQFGVPPAFKPIGAIALGYPAARDPLSETASPSRIARRPTAELLHYNQW
jgi:nitroreductase